MAELTSFETYKKRDPTPNLIVDMEIVEYFYVATLNDILNDEELVILIVQNPYYQQALCEANDVLTLTITCKNKEYTFIDNTPNDVPSTLEMLQGKTKYTFPDTDIINLR